MTKQLYGVWIGRVPGIYDNWNECKAQIDKFPSARYSKLKATNKDEALIEFNNGFQFKERSSLSTASSNTNNIHNKKPIDNVLTVDGAANGRWCEFQAVWYRDEKTKEFAFASKQLTGGTNNIAEFLGLVLAIQYLHKNNLPLKIYTDSVTAMAWVRNKVANTTANATGKATEELDKMIKDAENFLKENNDLMKKVEILKWETKSWGEIPADYGRK